MSSGGECEWGILSGHLASLKETFPSVSSERLISLLIECDMDQNKVANILLAPASPHQKPHSPHRMTSPVRATGPRRCTSPTKSYVAPPMRHSSPAPAGDFHHSSAPVPTFSTNPSSPIRCLQQHSHVSVSGPSPYAVPLSQSLSSAPMAHHAPISSSLYPIRSTSVPRRVASPAPTRTTRALSPAGGYPAAPIRSTSAPRSGSPVSLPLHTTTTTTSMHTNAAGGVQSSSSSSAVYAAHSGFAPSSAPQRTASPAPSAALGGSVRDGVIDRMALRTSSRASSPVTSSADRTAALMSMGSSGGVGGIAAGGGLGGGSFDVRLRRPSHDSGSGMMGSGHMGSGSLALASGPSAAGAMHTNTTTTTTTATSSDGSRVDAMRTGRFSNPYADPYPASSSPAEYRSGTSGAVAAGPSAAAPAFSAAQQHGSSGAPASASGGGVSVAMDRLERVSPTTAGVGASAATGAAPASASGGAAAFSSAQSAAGSATPTASPMPPGPAATPARATSPAGLRQSVSLGMNSGGGAGSGALASSSGSGVMHMHVTTTTTTTTAGGMVLHHQQVQQVQPLQQPQHGSQSLGAVRQSMHLGTGVDHRVASDSMRGAPPHIIAAAQQQQQREQQQQQQQQGEMDGASASPSAGLGHGASSPHHAAQSLNLQQQSQQSVAPSSPVHPHQSSAAHQPSSSAQSPVQQPQAQAQPQAAAPTSPASGGAAPVPRRSVSSSGRSRDPTRFTYGQAETVVRWAMTPRRWEQEVLRVRIATEPFRKGSMRAAFFMYIDEGSGAGRLWVAKRALPHLEAQQVYKRDTYFLDVQMQATSKIFATLYNQRDPPKKVDFVDAYVIQRHNGVVFAIEPYLEGDYKKHLNNNGFVDESDRNTPQAFAHSTYCLSNGQLIIVDIQGVADKYTDPQIHTASGKGFGKGNLGIAGMKAFFRTHRCNNICQYLNLPPPANGVKLVDDGTRIAAPGFLVDPATYAVALPEVGVLAGHAAAAGGCAAGAPGGGVPM